MMKLHPFLAMLRIRFVDHGVVQNPEKDPLEMVRLRYSTPLDLKSLTGNRSWRDFFTVTQLRFFGGNAGPDTTACDTGGPE